MKVKVKLFQDGDIFAGFIVHSKATADFITSKLGWQYLREQDTDSYFFSLRGKLTKEETVEELRTIFDGVVSTE